MSCLQGTPGLSDVLCVHPVEELQQSQEEIGLRSAVPEDDFDSEEEDLEDFIVYGPDEEQERRQARKERRHANALGISQSQLDEAASIFGGDMSEFLQNQIDEEDYEVRPLAF